MTRTVSVCLACALSLGGCGGGGGGGGDGDAAPEIEARQEEAAEVAPVEEQVEALDGIDEPDADADDGPDADAADMDEREEAGNPCPRIPGAADRARMVVVSHPYTRSGSPGSAYEVLELSAGGTLARRPVTFSMGRAVDGRIAFTPDGKVGIVAQDDGSLGVFRVNSSTGGVDVVHAGFTGVFWAAGVTMDPSGERAYVLDTNWRENHGGIYSVRIACDGSLRNEGLVAAAKLPYEMIFLPWAAGKAVVAAADILGSRAGDDVHLLAWGTMPRIVDGADAFGDDEAIVASAAVTADGRYLLAGDNSMFSGIDNRVAVSRILDGAAGIEAVQVLTPVEDPFSIVASPFDNAAIVVSGFGDAIIALDYDAGAGDDPFSVRGELDYEGAAPQLPGDAVMVGSGSLAGRVLVVENLAVRQVQFNADGSVTDLGATRLGTGYDAIPGAIGIQP